MPCCTMRPYSRAASTSLRPSNTLWLHGFSTYTSLPAWHDQMASNECQWFGVAIETASRFLSSRASRMSCTHFGVLPPQLLRHLAARSEQPRVGIDQVGDLDVLHLAVGLDVALPTAVDAGHGNANAVVGAEHLAGGLGAGDGERGGGKAARGGTLQKTATVMARHTLILLSGGGCSVGKVEIRANTGGYGNTSTVFYTKAEVLHS